MFLLLLLYNCFFSHESSLYFGITGGREREEVKRGAGRERGEGTRETR